MNEGVDLSDHVEIRYNGMTQWDCQMVANGPDSSIDSKVGAIDPSSDPIQQEPADETNGYAQTGFAGAKEARNQKEFSTRPLSILRDSVKNHTQVLSSFYRNLVL